MFSVRWSVNSVVYLQNREHGCSQKDNAENRVTYRLKPWSECPQVKISVTREKLEKKSIYRCNNAEKAQCDGIQSKNMFLVQESWKHYILAIKKGKPYWGYSRKDDAENSVTWPKTSKPLSLSQSQEKTLFWVKSREKQGDSLQTGRKPFTRAITLETTQLYGKQTVAWVQRVLANKNQNRCFLPYKAKRTQFGAN